MPAPAPCATVCPPVRPRALWVLARVDAMARSRPDSGHCRTRRAPRLAMKYAAPVPPPVRCRHRLTRPPRPSARLIRPPPLPSVIREIERINERELTRNVSSAASWHAQYKDSAYVYVGGLPYELNEGDVIVVFSQ